MIDAQLIESFPEQIEKDLKFWEDWRRQFNYKSQKSVISA